MSLAELAVIMGAETELPFGGVGMMSPSTLIRCSGIGPIVGGVLIVLFPLLHPNHDPEGFRSAAWVPVHLMPHVGAVLTLFGLVGVFVRQFQRGGWLGLIGFVAAFVGTAALLTVAMVEAFVIPYFSLEAPHLVSEDGPPPPGMGEAVITIQALLAVGYVLLGAAIARAGVLPWGVGALLAIGAVVFTFGHLIVGMLGIDALVGDASFTVGAALFGAGLAWMGYALWAGPDGQPAIEPAATPLPRPATAS